MKIGIKFMSFIAAVLMMVSCTRSYLDVNVSPNSVADAPVRVLLPNTTVALSFANSNELGKAAALLMQYSAGIINNSAAYDTWVLGSFDGQWISELYVSSVNNLGIIIQKTQGKNAAYSGIAKLELAYAFSLLTDLWGDVPYSQAAQGLDAAGFPKFPQPVFDQQMDIYLGNSAKGVKSLFNLVREGLGDIASAPPFRAGVDPASDDIVYGGTLSKWTRLGNSLLMKFALQVSNRAADTTTAVIRDIVNNNKPYIDAVDGSLDFNVSVYSAANPNAYYLQDIGGSIPNTQMLSNRFLALERSLNDSIRMTKFFIKPASPFVGYDNGSPFAAPIAANRSYYGTYVLGATRRGEAPIRLITAFRNNFILAEAMLRFGVAGDPNTFYQNGIRGSMKSTGMTDAEINTYFAANPTIVNLTGTTTQKLQQIITQKYVASVGNAIESYNDYRRTGYPVLIPPVITAGDDPNVFPQRIPYTNQEGASNPNQPNPRPKTNVKLWWAL